MESTDAVVSPIIGKGEYPLRLDQIVASLNKLITEVIAAQGDADSIAQALAGYVKTTGLEADFNAGGYEITNAKNATAPTSVPTLQQITAMIQAGTTDLSTIAITALGVGALSNGQLLGADNGALVGVDVSNFVTVAVLNQKVSELNQQITALQSQLEDAEGAAILGW